MTVPVFVVCFDMATSAREDRLVEWYKSLFASRTPPKSVLDADPGYRVIYTELREKMKELGYDNDPVSMRFEWDRIFQTRLRKWVNATLRAADEKPLTPRTPAARKAGEGQP